ncbi:MAG TPA: hypothetical protein VGD58_09675 [Herpetosiphonaceae bacterium]
MLSKTDRWREHTGRSTTYEAGGVPRAYCSEEDDQSFEEIRDETFVIIRLLTTESPTFGSG